MVSIKLITFVTSLLVLPIVLCQKTGDVKSLCDDPYIHSADRLPNNTYRVYRDNYYWELIGLPDRVAKVNGPFRIWYQHMAPLTRNSAVFTVVGGGINGLTYKFKDERLWIWNRDGGLRSGGKSGWDWDKFPKNGFSAAYNDGDLDKKGYPMLVAFSGIRVYYFNTKGIEFRRIGSQNGILNKDSKEKFPTDLTAAMPFNTGGSGPKYHVYLFKMKKYCYRPVTGVDGCPEWRDNKELFGCYKKSDAFASTSGSQSVNTEPQQSVATEEIAEHSSTEETYSSTNEEILPENPDQGVEDHSKSGDSSPTGFSPSLLPIQTPVLLLIIIFVKILFIN